MLPPAVLPPAALPPAALLPAALLPAALPPAALLPAALPPAALLPAALPGGAPGGAPPGGAPPGGAPPDPTPPVADGSDVLTQFRMELEVAALPGVRIPALTVMLDEQRGWGWSGVAHVNPRVASAEAAFQTLLLDGLVPGGAVVVKLVISGGSRFADVAVRFWPSVITAVSTTPSGSGTSNRSEAFCGINFQDPLSYLQVRPIWSTFAQSSLGEILGGVLSAAVGGDGRPTREPVLPGMPVIYIWEQLREEIGEIPYAIAAGEPLGYWLSRVCGRLGVRLEMRGDAAGRLHVDLCDGAPSESVVNNDGGVWMTVNPQAGSSAINLVVSESGINPPLPRRGALLDTPFSGGPRRFGRRGAVETVVVAARTGVAEAEKRAGFRRTNESLSRVHMSMCSRQPGLLPGRIVKIGIPPHLLFGPDAYPGWVDGFTSLFGANEWQVADISHLFMRGHYWNRPVLEKAGAAWQPPVPPEEGVSVVSGVVDDGTAEPGEPVERDRLGRIPVRFPFSFDAADTDGADTDGVNTDGADFASHPGPGDAPWPPSIPLAPVEPVAGNLHGFVSAHRQGDWCRVAVVNPLFAEIVGYGYRDDRYLNVRIRDATMGMVVQQGPEDWRGLLFRPDADLEREIEDTGGQGESPATQDDEGGSDG